MRTKVLYMLALLLVLSVGQAEAPADSAKMQGVEMRGGMASDNGYYMGMTLSVMPKAEQMGIWSGIPAYETRLPSCDFRQFTEVILPEFPSDA